MSVLTLEQVIELVNDVLMEPRIQGDYRVYPSRYIDKVNLYRDTYIEHLAIPELPIRSIAIRRLTGVMTPEEERFWDMKRQKWIVENP